MVDPIIGALIVGAGTTLIQSLAAYKQGEISEAEYRRQVAAANELERQLKTLRPDETWKDIDPKLLGEVARYSPDIATFVQEKAPQLIQEAQSGREQQIQREALQKYAAMSETGRDVISEAQREQALFEADARAKQRQQRLLEGLRRQGQLGSGAALAAQLQTEQGERVAARQEALQGVQQAEMRRREALGQAASLAGQLRGQNLQVESANVGTMNAFNQRLANAKNMYNQYVSGAQNQAQMINQQRQMDRERYNLGLQNQYALYNKQQALAAKERARQHDVNSLMQTSGMRNAAGKFRSAANSQNFANYATALTSGIGAGMGAYGAFNAANLKQAAQAGLSATGGLFKSQQPGWTPDIGTEADYTASGDSWDDYLNDEDNPDMDVWNRG